ncbi:MAG: AmmeMemoRadiSam system radical SAM enzyme [Planctomycetota bacterium]|jgi:pyruvate formate lyase activating enzyme
MDESRNRGCVSRRGFFRMMGRAAGAAAMASPAMGVLLSLEEAWADNPDGWIEGEYYEKLPGRKVKCYVCPFDCLLFSGETCRCRTRSNVKGRLLNPAWNNPCIIRMDPIEKMPLNHFLPGEENISLAVGGCMLRCLYCQNWQQSQARPHKLKTFDCDAVKAVEGVLAQKDRHVKDKEAKRCRTVGFTYTEPGASLEYVKAVCKQAKRKGVKTIVATAMFYNEHVVRDICTYADGLAVALKGWSDLFYHKVVGTRDPAEGKNDFKAVLKAIETARECGTWMEITTLLVPTYNDDLKDITAMAKWIVKNLGDDVPLHIGRFVPEFKLKNLPRTPIQTMTDARKAALDAGVKFVYCSNVAPHEGNNTFCPGCGKTLIQRVGFKILSNAIRNGKCPSCGHKIPGFFS